MADIDLRLIVRATFGISDWYMLSEQEEDKLLKYIREARNAQEAHYFRFLDCTTKCDEQFCYFCAAYEGDIQKLCTPCNAYTKRD